MKKHTKTTIVNVFKNELAYYSGEEREKHTMITLLIIGIIRRNDNHFLFCRLPPITNLQFNIYFSIEVPHLEDCVLGCGNDGWGRLSF